MEKLIRLLFFVVAAFVAIPTLHAQQIDCNHSPHGACASLNPDLRLSMVPYKLSSSTAFALMGEAGIRNYRINATAGMDLDCFQRVKVSAEYLTQKLRFGFSSGRTDRWVEQYAVGGAYEYFVGHEWMTNIEASVFYSHAFNRSLSTATCLTGFVERHIAGGRDVGATLGGNFTPWYGSKISLYANYDHIIYRRKFSRDRTIAGVGGTIVLNQQISDSIDCDFRAEFRRPFNYYFGLLSWKPSFNQMSGVQVGLFGSYTAGKSRLPSSTCCGIQLCFDFGGCDSCEPSCYDVPVCCIPCREDLCAWVATPAVYMPQVLAIAESNFIPLSCAGNEPTSTSIPGQIVLPGTYAVDFSSFFNPGRAGGPLTFSAVGLPAGSSIDPATGVVSGVSPADSSIHTVTITGTNTCGSTSQTFTISYPVSA